MFISPQKCSELSKVIEVISARHSSSRELRHKAANALLDLVDGDMCASYEWNPVQKKFESGVGINLSNNHVERYLNHFQYRHSPRMSRMLSRRGVSLVSDVVSSNDLHNSEIYTELLQPDRHKFGMNLAVYDGETYLTDLRIWRSGGTRDFTQRDVTLLKMLEPALASAYKRTSRALPTSTELMGVARAEGLSAREARIAGLVAEGLADKEIARQLDLSFATVRTHLNNAFKKLGVRNRTELATSLLDRSPITQSPPGAAL